MTKTQQDDSGNEAVPTVSVILASYNHAPFVAEAVQSVLDQTLREIELIVVDDGSTDGTPDIVSRIDDPRIRLIRLTPNRAYHPRNTALDVASGEYLAFQNSDDVWAPDKLAQQLAVMESQPKLEACFTGVQIIDGSGRDCRFTWANKLFTVSNQNSSGWLRQFFNGRNTLALPSAMVRTASVRKLGGFRGSLVQLSDLDLWVRLAATGEFHILPAPLTRIRVIKRRNLSAPTRRVRTRAAIELSYVLERYLQAPLLQRFPDIFPEHVSCHSDGAKKVALALQQLALRKGSQLFADRTLAEVLDHPEERRQAIEVFQASFIHDFLDRRCESAFTHRRLSLFAP